MTTATASAPPSAARVAFIRARLASILAVAPLGVWTVLHIWNNLSAWSGAEAWQSSVTGSTNPASLAITTVVVLLPLVIHTAWGIARMRTARPNNLRYGYYANLKYLLQRLSALGVALFLGAHLWLAFLQPRMQLGHPETFADISREMRHHGPTLVVYVLGTLGVAYHLANGIHSFLLGWGVVQSRASLKRLDAAAVVLFLVLLAASWGAIWGLWSAGA